MEYYLIDNGTTLNYSLLSILIYVYTIYFFFLILFILDYNGICNIYSLNEITFSKAMYVIIISSILSIAGVPPFIGFFNKLVLFSLFLKSGLNLSFLIFFFINIVLLYFYLRVIRFTIGKSSTNSIFNYKKFNIYMNINLIYSIIFLSMFNMTFLYTYNDLFVIFISNLV